MGRPAIRPKTRSKTVPGFIFAPIDYAVDSVMGQQEPPRLDASDARNSLIALRDAMLALHKTLVDSERVEYERTMGPILSANEFLRLLANDPWFTWLSPLTRLIVKMDEALDGEGPLTEQRARVMITSAFALLVADENGHGFEKQYFEALQRDPDVVMAHADVARMRPKRVP